MYMRLITVTVARELGGKVGMGRYLLFNLYSSLCISLQLLQYVCISSIIKKPKQLSKTQINMQWNRQDVLLAFGKLKDSKFQVKTHFQRTLGQ